MGRDSPTRSTSRSWSARRSFACSGSDIDDTSSMKSVPLVGQLEAADARGDGAGERALHVAEELGFGESFRYRGRVERDEALIAPRAVVMNRPRDEFLARAGLPLNQHGAVHR